MKIAINYSDENFRKAQQLNSKTAYKNGKVDKVIEYSPSSIDKDFKEQYNKILQCKRGGGYWLWKTYIIKRTLDEMEWGDYLFYCDSGAFYCNKIDKLIECLEQNNTDILAFEIPLIEKQWTKRDCFILMECDSEEYFNTNQRIATYILFKKTERVINFVNEYLNYCSDERILTDLENSQGIENYEGFIDHRHDQSVFSLLTKKYNIPGYKEPSQYGYRPWEYFKDMRLYRQNDYQNSKYSRIVISYRKANPYKFLIKEKIKDLFQKFDLRYI